MRMQTLVRGLRMKIRRMERRVKISLILRSGNSFNDPLILFDF